MKKCKLFFCGLLMSLSMISVQAQEVLLHEGFENHSPNCFELIDGCLPGWINTNGTTNIYEDGSGWLPGTSYMGEKHAHIYVTRQNNCLPNPSADQGEGMALNFNFSSNETYRITYALRGTDVEEVTWYVTDGLQSMGAPSSTACNIPETVNPPVTAASQAITPSVIGYNDICEWEVFQTDWFTPTSNFSQLWFRGSNLNHPASTSITGHIHLDEVIIQRLGGCGFDCPDPITDLKACKGTTNFGSIAFDCEAHYEWDIPFGNTAQEFTTDNHSAILQAGPGNYTVTITDAQGCSSVQHFEVIEDCCSPIDGCPPPENLECDQGQGGIALNWDPVPGVTEFILTIIFNDDDCGCGTGSSTNTQTEIVNGTEFIIDGFFTPCFSWSVQSTCLEDFISEPSEVMCFDGSQDCFFRDLRGAADSRSSFDEQTSTLLSTKVYPNPAISEINFELEIPEVTTLMIDVYDTNGKQIISFFEESVTPGLYQKTWSPEQNLPNGLYLIRFQTKSDNATETIIIRNNN